MNRLAFQPNLKVSLVPSWCYAGALCGLHLLVILAIAFAHLPPWLTLAALLGCLASVGWALRGWQRVRAITQLTIAGEQLTLFIHDEPHLAITHKSSLINPLITVLDLHAGGRRWLLPLLPDSAHPEDLRRLRVWLHRVSLRGARDTALDDSTQRP